MEIIKLKCDSFKVTLGKKNKASKTIPVEVAFIVAGN
jgi:hypothetical protein